MTCLGPPLQHRPASGCCLCRAAHAPSNSTTGLQVAMAGAGGAGGTRPRLNSSACHSRPSLSSHPSLSVPLARWMSQHYRKSTAMGWCGGLTAGNSRDGSALGAGMGHVPQTTVCPGQGQSTSGLRICPASAPPSSYSQGQAVLSPAAGKGPSPGEPACTLGQLPGGRSPGTQAP